MLDWAVEERSHWVKRNAAAGVKSLSCAKEGFHSSELEEVRQFEKRHPVGSTARLAMALTLYTGMRRSDAVLLGPDHVKNGWIKFTPKKASGTTGKTLELPLLKVLDDVINASATGAETFLVTSQGTK
jgi:integrase